MSKRKTYTSPEVKNRWNRKHYENVVVVVPIGSRDEIKAAAERHGQSVSAYIRALIIRDNADCPETTSFLRGGVADAWERQRQFLTDMLHR